MCDAGIGRESEGEGRLPEALALKHESRILGHSSNPEVSPIRNSYNDQNFRTFETHFLI